MYILYAIFIGKHFLLDNARHFSDVDCSLQCTDVYLDLYIYIFPHKKKKKNILTLLYVNHTL